jgi:hypothetical protein
MADNAAAFNTAASDVAKCALQLWADAKKWLKVDQPFTGAGDATEYIRIQEADVKFKFLSLQRRFEQAYTI